MGPIRVGGIRVQAPTRTFVAMAILMLQASTAATRAETRPVLPLPEGLYSDGGSCGAAEIRRNRLFNGFSVRDVIGDACDLKSVARDGVTYRFRAACSEGNGSGFHTWSASGNVSVTGPASFRFDGTDYRRCAADQGGGTSDDRPHADRHLPIVAGSYRAPGGKCGALEYLDNPMAPNLGAMFGGPAFGGDVCTVKRAASSGGRLSFEATCIPTRDGAAMRISVPVSLDVPSPGSFDHAGRRYEICKRIAY